MAMPRPIIIKPTRNYATPPAKELKYSITLPMHPEQQGNRDPRKVWMYDAMSGGFSVQFDKWSSKGDRTYYFELESDLLCFQLRWE
ncbi:MAG TPA: hypothetical protein VFM18_17995 [Methanosarcina sp.]|nr:hypothetical protein [Methanosarcina sp.]